VLSNCLVTRPLTDAELAATRFQTRIALTDTRTLRFYYRLLPGNRLQIGSRSAITGADADRDSHYRLLTDGLARKFPALAGIQVDHSWWGWVDVSHDMMPRVWQPDPAQQVFYALGYGGNGVSFSAHAGRRMAQRIAGGQDPLFKLLPIYRDALPFPRQGEWAAPSAAWARACSTSGTGCGTRSSEHADGQEHRPGRHRPRRRAGRGGHLGPELRGDEVRAARLHPLPAGLLALRFRGVPAAAVRAQAQAQLGLAGRGGLTQLGQFTFLFLALHVGMTAALASVLMQTQVFFTTLLGLMFLRERLTAPMVAGLGLASAGLACFALGFLDGGAPTGAPSPAGLLLNLLAAAMWALSNIVARRAQMAQPGFDAVQYVVWMSLVPLAPFAALAWWAEPAATRWQWLHASAGAWASVAYLGWLATVAAYGAWTWLLKRHPAGRIAPFSLGVPVIGLAAGTLLMGETITRWQWLGSACVVLALAVVVVLPGLRAALRQRLA
jgi:O-acetylserine/cysteine efflux transporter